MGKGGKGGGHEICGIYNKSIMKASACLIQSIPIINVPIRKPGATFVREYVDAFRAQGLKIGFYYSLIDWHHPDFPIDSIHPMRSCPDAYELNKTRDMRRYAEYMRNQVRELFDKLRKNRYSLV